MAKSGSKMLGVWTAIGAGAGAALGVARHNIPVWLSAGVVLGFVIGFFVDKRRS